MTYDPSKSSTQTAFGTRVVDAGLQSFMQGVYHTMGGGLVVTGLTAYGVANTPALLNFLFGTPGMAMVVMLSPLAFIFGGFTHARISRMSSEKLKLLFTLFSVVMGLSMAVIFAAYTDASIARVFFITAATFAATSLYGYTTKKDLAGVGAFLFMGLIGIFIAGLVNIFMQSAMVQFVVSAIGVVVFTGLTAWETQRLKNTYVSGATEANAKMAVVGALSLYLNFVNLFQMLLHFMGDRR